MIGVVLSSRRSEFYKYASETVLDFEEIMDPVGASDKSRYEQVFTDEPLEGYPCPVVDISSGDLAEHFSAFSRDVPTPGLSEAYLAGVFDLCYEEIMKPIRLMLKECKIISSQHQPSIVEDTHVTPIIIEPCEESAVLKQASSTDDISELDDLFSDDQQELSIAPQEVSQATQTPTPPQAVQSGSRFIPPVRSVSQVIPQMQQQTQQFIQPMQQPSMPAYGSQLSYSPQSSFMTGRTPVQTVRKSSAVMSVRGKSSPTKKFQVPIYTFSSLTHKAGVTTVAFSLATALAAQQPGARVLYLDLNLSNPNSVATMLSLNPLSDATIKTIMPLSETDFMQNIAFLTETVDVSQIPFSVISVGQLSLLEKRSFASIDYSYFLESLYNCFDIVLVDLGELQATLPYQAHILNMHSAKHFVVADGSESRSVNAFLVMVQQLTFNFEVVINKNVPQAGTFVLNQQLRRMPFATLSFHRNISRYLTGQLPIQGTALFTELADMGGKL